MNPTKRLLLVALAALIPAAPVLAGCGAGAEQSAQQKAGAEATAIIEQAEATAVVLRAQATARALLDIDSAEDNPEVLDMATPRAVAEEEPTEITTEGAAAAAPVANEPAPEAAATEESATPEPGGTPAPTEVLQVGFGSDGMLISVAYKSAPAFARKLMQGNVYVIDEKNGTKYGEVPVMPKVGPLLARPKEYGQVAYIMLVNGPTPIAPGDVVTVVLGEYKQEHVLVR